MAVRLANPYRRIVNVGWPTGGKSAILIVRRLYSPNNGSFQPEFGWTPDNTPAEGFGFYDFSPSEDVDSSTGLQKIALNATQPGRFYNLQYTYQDTAGDWRFGLSYAAELTVDTLLERVTNHASLALGFDVELHAHEDSGGADFSIEWELYWGDDVSEDNLQEVTTTSGFQKHEYDGAYETLIEGAGNYSVPVGGNLHCCLSTNAHGFVTWRVRLVFNINAVSGSMPAPGFSV